MAVVDQDFLRVSCNFELGNGTQYQNIYTLVRDGSDPYSDQDHVDGIETWVEAIYAELVGQVKSDTVEQLSFVDKIAWSGTQWLVTENIGTFTPTFAPTNVAPTVPHVASPFIIFKTARPRSVGKKFLFPFSEDQQDDTVLTGTAVTQMTAAAAVVLTPIALGGDATLTAGIVRVTEETWLVFDVAVVNDVIGSQKRRRPGVGA